MGTVISISPVKKKSPAALNELVQKAWEWRNLRPEQSLRLSQETLDHSNDTGFLLGKGYSLRNIAFHYWRTGNHSKAESVAREALTLFQKVNDQNGLADCHEIQGLVLSAKGKSVEALSCYLKAFKVNIASEDSNRLSFNLANIGDAYFQLSLFARAAQYFNWAFNTRSIKDEDLTHKAELLLQLGHTHLELNQPAIALKHFTESLALYKKLKDKDHQAKIYNFISGIKLSAGACAEAARVITAGLKASKLLVKDKKQLADFHYKMGELKVALKQPVAASAWFVKALSAYAKEGMLVPTVHTQLQLASLKIAAKKFKEAENLLSEAMVKACQHSDPEMELMVTEAFVRLYEVEQQPVKSLPYLRRALNLQKEVRDLVYQRHLRNLFSIIPVEKELNEMKENSLREKHLHEKDAAINEVIRVKKDILKYASHDLKSPLNSIKGIANLMSASNNDRRQINEYISLIEDAADQMLILVNEIQQASLIESGVMEYRPVLFDLSAQARLCGSAFLVQMQNKKQTLEVKAVKPHFVYADKEKISNVLTNLISNASKFSYLNQRITVKVSSGKGVTRCEVIDEGQGLTLSDMKDVFQQFKKLSARPTGSEESIGLGLYICKQVVEANKGKIRVKSGGRNKGSIFSFELPSCAPLSEN